MGLRVCVVVPSYYPASIYGGPIFSIHHTCKELALQGVEVFVSTTNANGNGKLEVEPNCFVRLGECYNVKYYDDTIIGRFSWRFIAFVWKDIRVCDLVRIEDIFSTYIPPSLFYARLFRKPILISPRGALSMWSLKSKRAILKKIWLAFLIKPFLRDNWWHATSEQEKNEILEFYPKAKVAVIPNGIDVEQFGNVQHLPNSEYMKKFAKVDKTANMIVVSMGRLHKKKGFDILIDAFGGLVDDFEDAVLLIAGKDDGERTQLEDQIARLGLEDKVFLIGEVSGQDKVDFLAGGDLFVLPSHSENFGNVYLEAMAAGLPIVASKGAPWERVEKYGCGKWVENSAEATRTAMREIMEGDRALMGELAKKFAAQYDWSDVARSFQTLFEQIANKAKPVKAELAI